MTQSVTAKKIAQYLKDHNLASTPANMRRAHRILSEEQSGGSWVTTREPLSPSMFANIANYYRSAFA